MRGLEGGFPPSLISLYKKERKWGWRLEVPQPGSQLILLQRSRTSCPVPSMYPAHHTSLTPWPMEGLPRIPQLPPLARSQNFLILLEVSGYLSFPSSRGKPCRASVPTLMPVCLSAVLCPRAPGAGCGVAWAGSPASASAPCHGSPSRRGIPTTSASGSGMSGWHAGKGR